MSTDFIALFDTASDKATPNWLLTQIAADPHFGSGVSDRYQDYWRIKTWMIETSPATGRPELLGPGGFAISFRPRTLELYHMMRFSTFTGDLECRDALRRACLRIADWVGSGRAIYTHELMPYDGVGLGEVERYLRAQIGPPAATFEELREAEYFGPKAWYIDSFTDLRNVSG